MIGGLIVMTFFGSSSGEISCGGAEISGAGGSGASAAGGAGGGSTGTGATASGLEISFEMGGRTALRIFGAPSAFAFGLTSSINESDSVLRSGEGFSFTGGFAVFSPVAGWFEGLPGRERDDFVAAAGFRAGVLVVVLFVAIRFV